MPAPSSIIRQKFPFEPTEGQNKLFSLLDGFIYKKEGPEILLLKGYAGTGKTSVVPALVKTLPLFNLKFMLLAPTGRAAKVMTGYAKRTAFTIHKIIYKQVADPSSGQLRFRRVNNYNRNTVFIVDESSMLSSDSGFGDRGVFSDLLEFVFEKPNNKLILIGDTAQLPPVGQEESMALDEENVKAVSGKQVVSVELVEVMRQQSGSGILQNATELRNQLKIESPKVSFQIKGKPDIFKMNSDRLEDGLRYAYDKYGEENTMIVCRSNRSAVMYNQHIRNTLLFRSEELEVGDLLMIVRNNYFYVPEDTPSGFLANGDFINITKIVSFEDLYDFRFATIEFVLVDYPDMEPYSAKVLLDTLHTNSPALTSEQNRTLYQNVLEDYSDIKNKKELNEQLSQDPYLNALQIKFAYAVTCHKSQGGQWPIVFVDQGYLREDGVDTDFVRWLYTAITRATQEVFLVNFDPALFNSEL